MRQQIKNDVKLSLSERSIPSSPCSLMSSGKAGQALHVGTSESQSRRKCETCQKSVSCRVGFYIFITAPNDMWKAREDSWLIGGLLQLPAGTETACLFTTDRWGGLAVSALAKSMVNLGDATFWLQNGRLPAGPAILHVLPQSRMSKAFQMEKRYPEYAEALMSKLLSCKNCD